MRRQHQSSSDSGLKMPADSLNDPKLAKQEWKRRLEEFPGSPVFARLAEALLREGHPATALKVAESGVQQHPDYATGLLIAAKANIQLRHYTIARELLHRVLVAAPACAIAALLIRELKQLELRFPPPLARTSGGSSEEHPMPDRTSRRRKKRWSWSEDLIGGEADIAKDGEAYTACDSRGIDERPSGVDRDPEQEFDFDKLAMQLESAKIPAALEPEVTPAVTESSGADYDTVDLQSRTVTETLASIYSGQGRFREAIDAYRALRDRFPERMYEFTLRIVELEQQLASSREGSPPTGAD
jgi:tetratricopeptide (TPR) repeat protein